LCKQFYAFAKSKGLEYAVSEIVSDLNEYQRICAWAWIAKVATELSNKDVEKQAIQKFMEIVKTADFLEIEWL
jgi:hypothetical protein